MGLISIDGKILRKMMIMGANNVTRNSGELDALNVFPVPDGDTGVNMSHTVQAAAREVEKLNTPNIYEVAKAASNGALRGARGNSGVILSQLFRGFAKGLEGKSVANGRDLAEALVESAKMAYRAVMKPKEGTILTIARALGDHAKRAKEPDIDHGLQAVVKGARHVLAETPSMLPELKQAGVVDSGGMGLLYFVEGALAALTTTETPVIETLSGQGDAVSLNRVPGAPSGFATEDIKFTYCTEFLIDVKKTISAESEESLTKFLISQGDSVVVVSDDTVVKVHVHTNHPGTMLERGLKLGSLNNIKIENMKSQHTNMIEFSKSFPTESLATESPATESSTDPDLPEKEVGFVAIAAGSGLCDLFKEIGADVIIEGGQTMNPSAEDITQAISRVNAKKVVVLPNNKNIILAAEQAQALFESQADQADQENQANQANQANKINKINKKTFVIPTRSIPQGITCLLDYLETSDLDEYLTEMEQRIKEIHSGQVTYAVRDTVVNQQPVSKGDILCMYNGDIVLTGKNAQEASKELLDYMLKEVGGEFVSIYYGEEINEDMAQELADYVTSKNPKLETDIYNGQQPLYYYIFSVE